MKKILFMGFLSLALILTACSKGKEEPPIVNALDEQQPIPPDTGKLKLTEQRFEDAKLILQLPKGVTAAEGETDEYHSYVNITDDAGVWEIKMDSFVNGNDLAHNVAQNWGYALHEDEDSEKETGRFSKKIDWSQDVAGTLAGFPARIWANNTALEPQESNPLYVPAVDIILDYGDTNVGRYYGLYVRLQFQHPVENDNIYEILHREDVRAILNNFSVIEGKDATEYVSNGVTVSIPARWEVLSGDSIVAQSRGMEKYKSLVLSTQRLKAPEEASADDGTAFTKQYGDHTYSCVIPNIGTEEDPKYVIYLYTYYDEEEGLVFKVTANIQGASEEELRAYMDDEEFVEIMESIQIDPTAYSDSSGGKEDGFKVLYGRLIEYTGNEEHVVVPATIKGHAVEEIDINVFRGNTTIKSVELPDTVIWIDNSAFEDCTALESVKLPETISTIGEEMFSGCTSLRDVVLPDHIVEIGNYAFANAGTGTFEATGGVVYGDGCFQKCGFSKITIADGSDLSAKDIFRESAVSEVQFPSDLTVLGEQAFYFCNNITELVLPDTVTEVGPRCFASMYNLKKLTLSQSLTELPEEMTRTSGVVNLSIPSSVTHIQRGAVEAAYVFLYNKEVQLDDEALDVRFLYLDGAYSKEDVPKNIEKQYIFSKIYIPVDATVALSDELDAYYQSLGMSDLSWFGPAEALCDMDTADYVAENHWLTAYQGNKKIVYVPAYTENGGEIDWIAAGAFAGNTTIEGICFTAVNSIRSYAFDGCTNLKKLWFGMASFSFLDADDSGIELNTFTGMPENVTVYFPASLTEEEFNTYEEIFRAKGMPASTVFERFTVEELKNAQNEAIEQDNTQDLAEDQNSAEEQNAA